MDYASILVVDDDEMIVYFFKMILDELGYNVLEAFSGEDAVKQATSTPVDLVILDYKLSDTTGDIVAKQLKEINPKTSVVFVTGYSDAKDRILRTNLSHHVVVKPIKENELIETVETALSERAITVSV
ncbi:MAG: response regulator [Candidatus Bathyarchaeota archaeon]|nr:response regulator [Candidatus Bathyarchaeota archaeon]